MAGVMVSVPEALPPSTVAVTVTDRVAVTAAVVTGNAVVVDPAVATTSPGTPSTAGSPLTSVTSEVLPSAGAERVTLPVAGLPPPTDEGLKVTAVATGPVGDGSLLRQGVLVTPPAVALTQANSPGPGTRTW